MVPSACKEEPQMNLEQIHKKIREAGFFLDKMIEEERRVGGDSREPFDFYLARFSMRGGR